MTFTITDKNGNEVLSVDKNITLGEFLEIIKKENKSVEDFEMLNLTFDTQQEACIYYTTEQQEEINKALEGIK